MLVTLITLIVYLGLCVDHAINLKVTQALMKVNFENLTSSLQDLVDTINYN